MIRIFLAAMLVVEPLAFALTMLLNIAVQKLYGDSSYLVADADEVSARSLCKCHVLPG
jgi:hypothetical protein